MRTQQLQSISYLLPTLLCSGLLTACGSSESTPVNMTDASSILNNTTPQATALTSANTSVVNLQARADASELDISDNGTELIISVRYDDVVQAAHSQIFFDTDNKTETGFGFHQEAWGKIGADFMIQNRYLYRSLSNDASWEWQPIGEVGNYTNTGKQINMVVSKASMANPCGSIQVGVMGRNATWGVEVMYPVATELAAVSINSCTSDTTAPVVTLNDSATISITQGSSFNDPGATAVDDVDGDVSSGIQINGSVDTSTLGSYTLTYQAMDSSGNIGYSPTRTVTVTQATATTSPGLLDSWGSLLNKKSLDTGSDPMKRLDMYQDPVSSSLYLDFNWALGSRISHTQIYLDTDNNPGTGYQAWANTSSAAEAGAEYMIEDGLMYQYTGTGIEWSWSATPTQLPYYFNDSCSGMNCGSWTTSMKMIIPSSIVSGSKVGIFALRISGDWTSNLIFANNTSYSLLSF